MIVHMYSTCTCTCTCRVQGMYMYGTCTCNFFVFGSEVTVYMVLTFDLTTQQTERNHLTSKHRQIKYIHSSCGHDCLLSRCHRHLK